MTIVVFIIIIMSNVGGPLKHCTSTLFYVCDEMTRTPREVWYLEDAVQVSYTYSFAQGKYFHIFYQWLLAVAQVLS
jgi:hypothetical protein